jgi:hypothetical protein
VSITGSSIGALSEISAATALPIAAGSSPPNARKSWRSRRRRNAPAARHNRPPDRGQMPFLNAGAGGQIRQAQPRRLTRGGQPLAHAATLRARFSFESHKPLLPFLFLPGRTR